MPKNDKKETKEMADNTQNGTEAPVVDQGNLNQTFPLPAGDPFQTFDVGNTKYRFCQHCHTPKPVAQVSTEGSHPGICVSCVNGINNYDKIARSGAFPQRPGAPAGPRGAQPKAAKIVKIMLADGREVEGALVKPPVPKRARRAAETEGESTNGVEQAAVPEEAAAEAETANA